MPRFGFLLVWLCCGSFSAGAHTASDSFLELRHAGSELQGRWDLPLRDLELALGLDLNQDGVITWGELKARAGAVTTYALARLSMDAGEVTLAPEPEDLMVSSRMGTSYAVVRFRCRGVPEGESLKVRYGLFFDLDRQHHGFLTYHRSSGEVETAEFSPARAAHELSSAPTSASAVVSRFCAEGIRHIWVGYDHILFLGALLLSGVLLRGERGGVVGVTRGRESLWSVLKVVTAFTLAHSITLSLAALGWVVFPPRLVEIAIAASVVVAAANNVAGWMPARGWLIAFAFGLIHGFGFASVLSELGLPRGSMALALASFNVGVELGQAAIAAVFLLLALAFKQSWFFQPAAMRYGSVVIALFGITWMAERICDRSFLPF